MATTTINQMMEYDNIKADVMALRLWVDGVEKYVTLSQWRLLMLFLSNPNRVWTYREIIAHTCIPTKEAISVQVYLMRMKFAQRYIHTVNKRGYRFSRVEMQ